MEDKNLKNMNANEEAELKEAEVNAYAVCATTLKIHCESDCITQDAFISTRN